MTDGKGEPGNVINMPLRCNVDEQRAELWAGMVRVLEQNGRNKIEIGLEAVRDIAHVCRKYAEMRREQ